MNLDFEQARQFLKALHGDYFSKNKGHFIEVRHKAEEGAMQTAFYSNPDVLLEAMPAWNLTHNYWPGMAPRSNNQGGKKEDVAAMIGVYADMDCGTEGHAKPSPYQTKAEALAALDQCPFKPSILVDSGGGLQPHWKLKEPIQPENGNLERFERVLKGFSKALKGDPLNAATILRLPGTSNMKLADNPRPVKMIYCHPERIYTFDELEQWAKPFIEQEQPPRDDNGQGSGLSEHEAYAQAALTAELTKLARSPHQGEGRNNQLNQSAYALGQLIGAGVLDQGSVEAGLYGTALSIGLTESETKATIRSGIEAGMREPRKLPERERPRSGLKNETKPKTEPPDQSPDPDQDYDRLEREAIQAEQRELPPDWRGPQATGQTPKDLTCEVLTPASLTLLTERLKTPPPPRKYLLDGILTTGIVGEIVAMGGTGKGYFIIRVGLSFATGENTGPLKPARTFKVVYLAGEDDQDELDRRVASTVNTLWPDGPPSTIDNFIPISVMGKISPLMELDKNHNPVNSPAYEWLCKSLENLADIDVLILDPKSKFYGLDENDNGHCAAWINCLESLADRFKITILFSHHESKARAGSMEQGSSRGGSALTDGCRWVANLKTMDHKTAEKFQVSDPRMYVVLDVTKSNYAPKLPAPIYFKRGSDGELMYVDLAVERLNTLTLKLVELLEINSESFSRNDLIYEKRGKEIADELKETVSGFNRVADINRAINHGLRSGWLFETRQSSTRGRGKLVLKVKTGPEA